MVSKTVDDLRMIKQDHLAYFAFYYLIPASFFFLLFCLLEGGYWVYRQSIPLSIKLRTIPIMDIFGLVKNYEIGASLIIFFLIIGFLMSIGFMLCAIGGIIIERNFVESALGYPFIYHLSGKPLRVTMFNLSARPRMRFYQALWTIIGFAYISFIIEMYYPSVASYHLLLFASVTFALVFVDCKFNKYAHKNKPLNSFMLLATIFNRIRSAWMRHINSFLPSQSQTKISLSRLCLMAIIALCEIPTRTLCDIFRLVSKINIGTFSIIREFSPTFSNELRSILMTKYSFTEDKLTSDTNCFWIPFISISAHYKDISYMFMANRYTYICARGICAASFIFPFLVYFLNLKFGLYNLEIVRTCFFGSLILVLTSFLFYLHILNSYMTKLLYRALYCHHKGFCLDLTD